MTEETPNKNMISLLQYIGAILVILLHCRRVFDQDSWHFIQKSIFSRMVVPYFMVIASFFLAKRWQTDGEGIGTYVSKQVPAYLKWSVLYLPYAILVYLGLGISLWYLPLALVVGLAYTGLSYQLWYIPAFLQALLLVTVLRRRLGFLVSGMISLFLYLIGSLETYTAFLEDSLLGRFFWLYQSMFFTTRNGLFYAPIFVWLGFFLWYSRSRWRLSERFYLVWLLTALCFAGEAYLIFHHQGQDKNFFLSLLPWTACLVVWSIQTPWFKNKSWTFLRDWSRLYYFSHVAYVEIGFWLLLPLGLAPYVTNRLVFIGSLFATHLTAVLVSRYGISMYRKV